MSTKLQEPLMTPFNMIITGMTACGKTHYLLKMIETDYANHFDYIFLICPTYQWNKTYQDWKYNEDKDFVTISCDQDYVEDFLKHVVSFANGTNSLIILDDCASSQSVKERTSELVRLAFSARHFGLSTIVVTQQLTSIAKPYRENISKLITFYSPNKGDMKIILDNYLDIEKDEVMKIKKQLRDNKYARLEVLLRYPFTHEVIIPQVINE